MNVVNKSLANDVFLWDDDPYPVWESGLEEIIWPEPKDGLLQSGLVKLDEILGGIRKESLVVIGGKIGSGKSDFAEMLAYNFCWRQKIPGMFFAPRKQDRFTLAGLAAIHGRMAFDLVVANGDGTEQTKQRVHSAIRELSSMRLVLDDRGGLSLRDIRERVQIAKQQYGVRFVVIDKWQNYSNPYRFDDTGICYLKDVARTFDLPVVLFTRMSKAGATRLTVEDVDESGFLDHPDVVIMMHNDERSGVGELELEVVKNKYCGLGSVRTAYIDHQHRIENLAIAQ